MIYDLIVIGGGPAGMMAAGRAGELGARVLLIEKNDRLGVKLLATGHGRCNITNTNADDKQNNGIYGSNSKFLFSAFNKFGVNDTIEFFKDLGVDTMTEENGRVFPQSNQASEVQLALMKYLDKSKVEVMLGGEVKKIVAIDKKIKKIILKNNKEIIANNFVIAVGGKSYPGTGSTGDGYDWLASLGHTINTPRPALTSVIVKNGIAKQLEGLSLSDVELSIHHKNKKVLSRIGEIVFTADGVSGPAIIDMSSRIGELLPEQVQLKIDLQPSMEVGEFEKKIQKDFHNDGNKMFKNYLSGLVAPKFLPVLLKLTGINEEKRINSISKEERKALVSVLKEFTLEISALKGFDRAMLTAGGVDIREIDPRTMQSRICDNLYLAGEILDLDGPSGGYNLQICWSTGYVVGGGCFRIDDIVKKLILLYNFIINI